MKWADIIIILLFYYSRNKDWSHDVACHDLDNVCTGWCIKSLSGHLQQPVQKCTEEIHQPVQWFGFLGLVVVVVCPN